MINKNIGWNKKLMKQNIRIKTIFYRYISQYKWHWKYSKLSLVFNLIIHFYCEL